MARVIIVDDEPVVLRVMRLALERAGYDVEACANGHDALEAVCNAAPDALITDIEMPRMTGEELCHEIHRLMPERRFPIFVSTSLTAIEHRSWSDAIPNLNFLEKPISARRLVALLDEHLAGSMSETG